MNKTNETGQLEPLTHRLNPHQQARRDIRIEARKTIAQQLSREHAITRGIAATTLSVLRRGLWGRLKWLLFGR